MLTGQTQPLTIAAKILKPTTIQAVRRSPSYHLQGWKILDRWAFNSPEKLRSLEAQGEVILLGRLLEQQTIEHQVLSRSIDQKQNGLTEHEILASNEINTELQRRSITRSPPRISSARAAPRPNIATTSLP